LPYDPLDTTKASPVVVPPGKGQSRQKKENMDPKRHFLNDLAFSDASTRNESATITSFKYNAQGYVPYAGTDTQVVLFGQFLKLFPLRINSLVRKVGTAHWSSMSRFHYLSDDEIRASIVNQPTHLRACSFDIKTNFAVLGIPGTSRYNGIEQFRRLTAVLTQSGLKPKTYKSAGSDDLHIYLPFTEEVLCNALARALSRLLMHKGFELSPQTLVVYPSDSPLVLPLQAGFAWLNEDLQVKVSRGDISIESALALFLADLSRSAVSLEVLHQGFVAAEVAADLGDPLMIDDRPQLFDQPQPLELDVLLDLSDQPPALELGEQHLSPVEAINCPQAESPCQPASEPFDHLFVPASETAAVIWTAPAEIADEMQIDPSADESQSELTGDEQAMRFFEGALVEPVELDLGDVQIGQLETTVAAATKLPWQDPGTQLLLFPHIGAHPPAPPTIDEWKQGRRSRHGLADAAGESSAT
jgi:hypothetical protein